MGQTVRCLGQTMTNSLMNHLRIIYELTLKKRKIILTANATGEVAQSVERETENLCVGGSIPSLATALISSEKVDFYGVIPILIKGILRNTKSKK